MIYVASSWRNPFHTAVVAGLRSARDRTGNGKFLPYDFRNPTEGNHGFHWSEVGMPSYNRDTNGPVPVKEYIEGVDHPIALDGFKSDFDAMKSCDTCVLVLPCGASAHTEAGWFAGQGKPTAVLLDDPMVPELMYKIFDYLAPSFFDLLGWLGVPD